MMKGIVTIAVIVVLLQRSTSQPESSTEATDDRCSFYDRCGKCIREPGCKWCSKLTDDSSEQKCFSIETNLTAICEESTIEKPENSEIEYLENVDFSDGSDADSKIIQLKPQNIKLSLRKGVPKRIYLQYKPVTDYPLDLYYLMDLSQSMDVHKSTLATLGNKIAETMRKLTSKFRIGFGSFVDKVLLPFVDTNPETLKNPGLAKDGKPYATPFSFHNNLKLTEEDDEFTKRVRDARISTNQDTLEGGFDALMQTMVCGPKIGWRDNVRKIIVFSTDAGYHSALDGKLAGVVLRNDGICHLNSNEYYDKYDVYDYPSVGQIREVAKEQGFNIIFAVKSGVMKIYEELASVIEGAKTVELRQESSNIVNLLAEVYNEITGTVKILEKSSDQNSPVSLKYFSKCNDPLGSLVETDECKDIKPGKVFNFTVELKLDSCPSDMKTTNITLGTLQDTAGVNIEIELLCDCDCENTTIDNAVACSKSGTLQCGVCFCNEDSYGQECICKRGDESASTSDDNESKCKARGAKAEDPACSGRGICDCGACRCTNKFVSGVFCQCNRAQCMQNLNAEECSGHGKCNCDACQCEEGWQEEYCECKAEASCIQPGTNTTCSNHGKCNCEGMCNCQEKDGVLYFGEFCEECPSCGRGKCLEFEDCVLCVAYNSGKLGGNACKKCPFKEVQYATSQELNGREAAGASLCNSEDETTSCDFSFTYQFKGANYEIYALENQECQEKVVVFHVLMGIVGGIVLLGILTLILWKIFATLHDQREFSQFERERLDVDWDAFESPLYENPTTTTKNPAFNDK